MKPWPWLGDAEATTTRRSELRRLLGPLPALDAEPNGELIETQITGASVSARGAANEPWSSDSCGTVERSGVTACTTR